MEELNKSTTSVLDRAFTVHRNLGLELFEYAYQMALGAELSKRSIPFTIQQEIPLEYKGRSINTAHRLYLLIDNKIIVELKSVDVLPDLHFAQILTFLKLTNSRLG